jgi:hypothetical protein
MRTQFWLEILNVRDYLEDRGVGGRILLKWILGKYGLGIWIGFIRLRIGADVGLL